MISVNDGKEQVIWFEGMTVRDLLRVCNYTFPNVLVTVNGRVIPPESYAVHPLYDGDEVKVLHFFGGG